MRSNHTLLPDDLTFEDFNRYANCEPDFEGNWIYKVEQAFFIKKRRRSKSQYPKIEIDRREERYFLTYPDAVEFIQKNKPDDLYCSWVTQVPVGEPEYHFGAAWLYDRHGEMIDYTITYRLGIDDSFDKDGTRTVFWGRPQSRLRFKKGDIVEVYYRDEVTLAVVDRDVTDVECSWDLYNRCRKEDYKGIPGVKFYILDYSDESMIVIDGPSYACHDHVSPLLVMKPRFPIPAELEAEMNTWIERAEKEAKENYEQWKNEKEQ